ncbi:Non-homologous end joining protein Ku [Streptomyces glaucescens]
MLRVVDDVIVMHGLLWPDEVRAPEGVAPDTSVTVRDKELDLADALMDTLGEVDLSDLHDEYREAVEEVIAAKAAGETPPETPEPARSGKVLDLMAALENSVRAAKESRGEGADVTPLTSRPAPKQTGGKKSTSTTPAKKTTAKKTTTSSTKKSTAKSTTQGTKKTTAAKNAGQIRVLPQTLGVSRRGAVPNRPPAETARQVERVSSGPRDRNAVAHRVEGRTPATRVPSGRRPRSGTGSHASARDADPTGRPRTGGDGRTIPGAIPRDSQRDPASGGGPRRCGPAVADVMEGDRLRSERDQPVGPAVVDPAAEVVGPVAGDDGLLPPGTDVPHLQASGHLSVRLLAVRGELPVDHVEDQPRTVRAHREIHDMGVGQAQADRCGEVPLLVGLPDLDQGLRGPRRLVAADGQRAGCGRADPQPVLPRPRGERFGRPSRLTSRTPRSVATASIPEDNSATPCSSRAPEPTGRRLPHRGQGRATPVDEAVRAP